MKHKTYSFNFWVIAALSATFYVAVDLLLYNNSLHITVADIIAHSHELSPKWHLLILGLVPIYIAIIIFGAAIIGIFVGDILQRLIRSSKPSSKKPTKSSVRK